MIRLSDGQMDEAAWVIARAIDLAEDDGFRTKLGRAYMVLGALSMHFDIEPKDLGPVEGPFANDETEAAIEAIWANAYAEVEDANALFDWVQGTRP